MTDDLFYYVIEFIDGDTRGLTCLKIPVYSDHWVQFLSEDNVEGQYISIPTLAVKAINPVSEEEYNEAMSAVIEDTPGDDLTDTAEGDTFSVPRGLIPGL